MNPGESLPTSSDNGTEFQPQSIRVVLADDHPIVRDGLRKLLILEDDIEVVGEASDGREVVQVVQETRSRHRNSGPPDAEHGWLSQHCRRCSSSNVKRRVIVLTASEDKNEFVQAMKLGCSGIVLKQTAPELIVKSIRKVHSGEIWLDSHTTAAVMRQFAVARSDDPGRNRQGARAFSAEPARA